jgi:hypothetical protein
MSSGQMSRRKFLAVIGGAGSALGIAGLSGWRLLGNGGESSAPVAGEFAVDPGVEVVEVAPGFVDATVWNDELLTLRASPAGTGIVLHSETTGTHHPIDVPDGFAARCVGVIDDTVVIGGHRHMEADESAFDVGAGYDSLLRRSGAETGLLLSQPGRPVVVPYRYRPVERVATAITSSDLASWAPRDLYLPTGTAGSVAAVLEHSSHLALDRYAYAEHPDSVFEAYLLAGDSAKPTADGLHRYRSLPIDHGSIWGAVADERQDLVVIDDRQGIVCYGEDSQVVFSIPDGSDLLGVQFQVGQSIATIVSADGNRETRIYSDGREVNRQVAGNLVAHQVSPQLTIATSTGKAAALFAKTT